MHYKNYFWKFFNLLLFSLLFGLIGFQSVMAQDTRGAGNRQLIQETLSSGKRLALVIGNAAYPTAPLKNPVNDATDIAATLRETGFEVIHKENLNQTEMKRAVREFGAKLKTSGGVGLFYFAGHGVQVKGINYLVPIDATIESEEEMEYEAVDAGFVLAQMEAAQNSANIVILDACRNNPFARSFRSADKGLAQMDVPSGTIIAYATAPGSVASDGTARNGLYTQELLKNIRSSGLGIEEVFKRVRISVRGATGNKQTPWESSSLVGDFYFIRDDKAKQQNSPIASPTTDSSAFELAYWDSIKNSSNPEDFKEYIMKYPNGQFAGIAKRRSQPNSSNETESGNSNYLNLLASAEEAMQKKDATTAIDLLQKAISLNSSKAQAYEQLGSIYYERKDFINSQQAMLSAINNGGKVTFENIYYVAGGGGFGGRPVYGKIIITKSICYLKSDSKALEFDISDVVVQLEGKGSVDIKIRDGLSKKIKGTIDGTEDVSKLRLYFNTKDKIKERVTLLMALIGR